MEIRSSETRQIATMGTMGTMETMETMEDPRWSNPDGGSHKSQDEVSQKRKYLCAVRSVQCAGEGGRREVTVTVTWDGMGWEKKVTK